MSIECTVARFVGEINICLDQYIFRLIELEKADKLLGMQILHRVLKVFLV